MRYPHPKLDQLPEPARSLAQAEYARLRDAGSAQPEALQLALKLAQEWSTSRGAAADSEQDRPGKLRRADPRTSG